MVAEETVDRGKTPVDQEPSPSYSHLESATAGLTLKNEKGTEDEKAINEMRREEGPPELNIRDLPYKWLDLHLFDGSDAIN